MRPNLTQCTRHAFTLLLALSLVAAGAGVARAFDLFSDVPDTAFYHDDVGFLFRNGITAGVAPGQFGPGQAVLRGQMATFLRAAFQAGLNTGLNTGQALAERSMFFVLQALFQDTDDDGTPDLYEFSDTAGTAEFLKDQNGDGRLDIFADNNQDGTPDFFEDTDGDGVIFGLDNCPNLKGPFDSFGCPG